MAKNDVVVASQSAQAINSQTTKDIIVHLIHLFKEPSAQRHWTNLHGVLNQSQLDARKSPPMYSEASDPLSCLAEMLDS